MRVSVDQAACELHGQCVAVAPAVFAFDDDEHLVYSADISSEHKNMVNEAISFCPAQAITLEA